jgi:hypothetical protein
MLLDCGVGMSCKGWGNSASRGQGSGTKTVAKDGSIATNGWTQGGLGAMKNLGQVEGETRSGRVIWAGAG